MAKKKVIPSIHIPIQEPSGTISWVWYMFLQWLAENTGKIDLSDYFTKEETEALLDLKADIEDLATVAFTGDYEDLSNKPDIPAPQIQSDWTQTDTDAVDYIKNKPVLATVATSGSYNDLSNKPTIPAAQVNADWNANSGVAEILNKPTLGTMAAESASDYTPTSGLATVATSGSYNDLLNKPTIPTVGNGTITITQDGITKGTFTTNQSSNTTIALDGGGSSTFHPDLFDHKWSDYEISDMNWLRADTFSWQDGTVYEEAYNHLVADVQTATLGQSETIAGYTIFFDRAADGHKIVNAAYPANITALENIYAATGVAWYYIIDTANQRFKLPRTKFAETGLRDTVGKYVAPGLPNITGSIYGRINTLESPKASGAFSVTYNRQDALDYNEDNTWTGNFDFDASRSSSIYGNSATVQPPATQMYLYFYVGNFTQTALENTAGLNASLFNGKADLNLANAAPTSSFAQALLNVGIDTVVQKQDPTSGNNYTWYRCYKSGWIEQGGITASVNGTAATRSVTMPIAMSDANYSLYITITRANPDYRDQFLVGANRTTTGFTVYSNWAGSGNGTKDNYAQWMVCGYKA